MGSSSLAAITAVYNEADFLPQFLAHYGQECDHLFVLDNESDPPASTMVDEAVMDCMGGCSKIEVEIFKTGGKFDTRKKQQALLEKKRQCVGKFDYVLILDCDEFVVAKDGRPIKESLGDRPIYGTHGINMYGYPDDPPYNPGLPLFHQRRRGIENRHYSKPIIVRPEYPVTYSQGCHYVVGEQYPQVCPPEAALFYLLHYRGFDEEIFVRRSMERPKRIEVWNPVDGAGVGGYYWGGDPESFRAKYRYERDAGQPFILPSHVKGPS